MLLLPGWIDTDLILKIIEVWMTLLHSDMILGVSIL